MAVNIPDGEIQRLYELEQNYAASKSRTDLELDQIKRVWDGNVDRRTIAEMLRGGGGGSSWLPWLCLFNNMSRGHRGHGWDDDDHWPPRGGGGFGGGSHCACASSCACACACACAGGGRAGCSAKNLYGAVKLDETLSEKLDA